MITRRRCYLIVRVLLLIGCLTGFIYQVTIFLLRYYSYPVILTQDAKFPKELDLPAFSFCNFNMYRRTVFCSMYRDKCKVTNDSDHVCKSRPRYCKDNKLEPNFLMPQVPIESLKSYPRDIHRKLAHIPDTMIAECLLHIPGRNSISCDTIGPFIQYQCVNEWYNPSVCYMFNSKYGDPNGRDTRISTLTALEFVLYAEEDEYFPDVWYPKFNLAVHNTKSIFNPYDEGIILHTGRTYYVSVTEEESNLLPYPYATNCTDTHQIWKMRGGKGPLQKNGCVSECSLNKSLELYGCAVSTVMFPHSEQICENQFDLPSDVIMDCADSCTVPCYEKTYQLTIDVNPDHEQMPQCKDGTWSEEKCSSTRVIVYFTKFMIMQYTTQPQYTSVEIFSNVGGYLGMWLGVSLLSLYHLTEPVVCYVLNFFKKRQRKKAVCNKIVLNGNRPITHIV